MADTSTNAVMSVYVTVNSKLPDFSIKDGQLIFVRDKHKIALDFDGKRVFYHQIEEIATEAERAAMLAPVTGAYYFVIDKAILWTYNGGWIQITSSPEEIVYIGSEMPSLGSAKTLYVDTAGGISIWDTPTNEYVVVADKCIAISDEKIAALFQ